MDLSMLTAPLVGLGTALIAYLGWFVVFRILPAPLQSLQKLWILGSLALGVLGWWLAPCEGRFPAEVRLAWQDRATVLATRVEWARLQGAWQQLGQVGRPGGPEGEALEATLLQVVHGLAGLRKLELVTPAEENALARLALERAAYRMELNPNAPPAPKDAWKSQMEALEGRLRFLSLVVPGPESEPLLWQQRVRLSRELARLSALRSASPCESGPAVSWGSPCDGPAFARVDDFHRTLALLVCDLSVPTPASQVLGEAPSFSTCGSVAPSCGSRMSKCGAAGCGYCQGPGTRACGSESEEPCCAGH